MPEKDEDIELLRSKKMLERWSKIAKDRKMKMSNEQQKIHERNDRELVLSYLYDMGEEIIDAKWQNRKELQHKTKEVSVVVRP